MKIFASLTDESVFSLQEESVESLEGFKFIGSSHGAADNVTEDMILIMVANSPGILRRDLADNKINGVDYTFV